jgi:hypothetical protein
VSWNPMTWDVHFCARLIWTVGALLGAVPIILGIWFVPDERVFKSIWVLTRFFVFIPVTMTLLVWMVTA